MFWLIHYRCISSKFHDYPAARVNLQKIWCLHGISQKNLPFLPSAVGYLHFGICLFYICTSQVNKYTLPDEKHCVSCPWNSFLMWTHKSNLPFLPSAVGFLHFGICLFYPGVSRYVFSVSLMMSYVHHKSTNTRFQMKKIVFHVHETLFLCEHIRQLQGTNLYLV